ncbi:class I adenylate-forming enzyme family protein [Roseospirillum parvum]|uniref:3-methylmercaptopropionyl-CoA ligase n=1 Tax=Roseospirillum parvum TaxID=83401 RepID=A0A1G7WB16_9PROT|nr:AMP-binding protein [Roseospirillum parvum]SDG69176.1 long-chain acyl-CoA synthetase [Roseospirillum parvum]
MNLAHLLARAGRAHGARPAVALGTTVTHDQARLAGRVAALAATLRQRFGLAEGARIGLAMKNCPAYVEVMFAAWWAGLVAVPMNPKLHPKEFAHILTASGTRVCFVTADLASAIAEAANEAPDLDQMIEVDSAEYEALFTDHAMEPFNRAGDDLAWLFYTSGTTGRPKGAMLSHRNLLAMSLCYFADVDTIAPGDAILHAAPMSHGSGMYMLPHVAGLGMQVIPESGGFEPAEILELFQAHQGVAMFAAPTMVQRLIDAPGAEAAAHSGLKTIVYGGGPMYVSVCKRALDLLGPRLVQIYGQGESPMTITALSKALHAERGHARWEERLASVGIAQSAVEVMIADPEGHALPDGEIGEVVVRGETVMSGYWQDPGASAKTLRDGWLYTGDMGSLDPEGFLTLKDRSKDVVISGGTNIYPREVEEVLLTHPKVAEVACLGRPHPSWGEELVAFIVPAGDAPLDPAELDALCLDNIARFKRPKDYLLVDHLPKNITGKVLKTELRQWLKSRP